MNFLFHTSDAYVFLFMITATIVFSLSLIVLNKFFIFYKLKYKDNPVTASIASQIGIVYGILVGIICLYLINNTDHASTAALDEGTAAADIYRGSKWLKEPHQHQIQSDLKNYINKVITIEWPAMSAGKTIGLEDGLIIDKMSNELINYQITTKADEIIITDMIQDIKSLFKARQQRIEMSTTELSLEIWDVILICTILIIVINYAFRVNLYLHIFTITAFAIMAASILFLLVTLDRPFQGEFIVEPDALQAILDIMNNDKI